ncbi:hypothetical protein MW887_006503 [Aspergillus wentii]|nr:hypothetical protein MW887_006503 [Aspergillus wentii]
MGLDYLLVHAKYNIPLSVVMTSAYWPFFTKIDRYRIWTLVTIAVVSTIPWDSYLIVNSIWTYPPDAVIGPTLWSIPLEEVFFFIIQTYNTSLLYIMLTKRLVLPMYLGVPKCLNTKRNIGTLTILTGSCLGIAGIYYGEKYTYIGLILAWVCPFMLLQWVIAYRFMLQLPRREILVCIFLPTFYLWAVDTIALGNGTWVIEDDTKLNIQLWGRLDIEEALFFLVTNVMIILGQMAIDNAVALATYKVAISELASFPSFGELIALYIRERSAKVDEDFVDGLSDAVQRLAQKSQSMYMGSAMFQGQLRIDLIFLYSFCRVMDDLVDEAPNRETANRTIRECNVLLKKRFCGDISKEKHTEPSLVAAIQHLPINRLSIEPLQGLLEGFETDLNFDAERDEFPISTEEDLEKYAFHVAGTVAESMVQLILSNIHTSLQDEADKDRIIRAATKMGQALQYVNIVRDVARDAEINRVYIPTTWLKEAGMTPSHVIAHPTDPRLHSLKMRLLDKADECHDSTEMVIRELPREVQGPIRVTVEGYMEIGKMLRETGATVGTEKPKVSLWRRLRVAYRAVSA